MGPLTVNGGEHFVTFPLCTRASYAYSIGIIADVWPALGRGPATSLFSASVFMGPVLGPIVGGL